MGNTISTRSNVKNSGLGFHPPALVQPHRLLKYSSTSLLDSPQHPAPSPNTHPARHRSLSPTRPTLDLTTKELMPGPAENPGIVSIGLVGVCALPVVKYWEYHT